MARHKRAQAARGTVSVVPLPPAPGKGLLKVRLPPSARNGTFPTVYSPSVNQGDSPDRHDSSLRSSSGRCGPVKRVRICVDGDAEQPTDLAMADVLGVLDDVETSVESSQCDNLHVSPLGAASIYRSTGDGKEILWRHARITTGGKENAGPKMSENPHWLKLGLAYKGFCPFVARDFSVPRVPYTSVTPKEFFDKFVKMRRPCVLTVAPEELTARAGALPDGLEELMPLLRRWKDDDYLRTSAGAVMVDVEVREGPQSFGEGRKCKMKFSDVLDSFADGKQNYYITTQNVAEDRNGPLRLGGDLLLKTSLTNDYPNVPSILNTLVPYQYNVWMGSSIAGSSTGLHHDFHDNLYVLIRGTKTFRLFSPRVAEGLATEGTIHTIHPNGLICYDATRRCDGADKAAVYGWRIAQSTGEIAVLEARLTAIEEQTEELRNLIAGKKRKKRKKKKATNKTLLNDSLVKQLSQSQLAELQPEILLSELHSREESARLVREYIVDATERKKNFEELLLNAVMSQDCGTSEEVSMVENDTSGSTSATTSLDALEATLTPEQKCKLLSKKERITSGQMTDVLDESWEEDMESDTAGDGEHENGEEEKAPNHFCRVRTQSRDGLVPFCLPDSSQSMSEVAQQLAQQYMEVTLQPNEMLYLPASWFHEVISSNSEDGPAGHMAFNFWFYPPNAPECRFEEPYPDEFWLRRFRKLLETMQLEWQFQQLAALRSAGGFSLMQLLAGAEVDSDSQLFALDPGALDEDGIDDFDADLQSNSSNSSDDGVTTRPATKKASKKKAKKIKSTVAQSVTANNNTTCQDAQLPLHVCPNTTKSVREAYTKHMQLRNRGVLL